MKLKSQLYLNAGRNRLMLVIGSGTKPEKTVYAHMYDTDEVREFPYVITEKLRDVDAWESFEDVNVADAFVMLTRSDEFENWKKVRYDVRD